jgi:hypothetical protein
MNQVCARAQRFYFEGDWVCVAARHTIKVQYYNSGNFLTAHRI